jgi:hypothetical protein
MSIPGVCSPLQARIDEIDAEIAGLQGLLSGAGLPPGEPPLSPSEKAAIGQQINRLRATRREVQRELEECVRDNTPPPDPGTTPALAVTSLMATQSVQTLDNTMRLVRSKRTAVRVFVVSGISNGFDAGAGPNRWPNVSGELRVRDPATGFSSGPIAPLNPGGAITAVPVSELNVDNPGHSLSFRLPLSAVSVASLEITARVFVRGHENDPGGWTARGATSVTFTPRRSQEITPFLIAQATMGLPAPTLAQWATVLRRGALARFPVPFFVVNRPITLTTFNPMTSVPFGWAPLLSALATAVIVGQASGGIRAGLVTSSPAHPIGGMGTPRIGFAAPAFVSQTGNEALFAHEMGHSHGLNHSVCSGTEPILHDDRLPGRSDVPGFHVEDGAVVARGTGEIMSYCPDPLWPSRAAYDLIFDNPA